MAILAADYKGWGPKGNKLPWSAEYYFSGNVGFLLSPTVQRTLPQEVIIFRQETGGDPRFSNKRTPNPIVSWILCLDSRKKLPVLEMGQPGDGQQESCILGPIWVFFGDWKWTLSKTNDIKPASGRSTAVVLSAKPHSKAHTNFCATLPAIFRRKLPHKGEFIFLCKFLSPPCSSVHQWYQLQIHVTIGCHFLSGVDEDFAQSPALEPDSLIFFSTHNPFALWGASQCKRISFFNPKTELKCSSMASHVISTCVFSADLMVVNLFHSEIAIHMKKKKYFLGTFKLSNFQTANVYTSGLTHFFLGGRGCHRISLMTMPSSVRHWILCCSQSTAPPGVNLHICLSAWWNQLYVLLYDGGVPIPATFWCQSKVEEIVTKATRDRKCFVIFTLCSETTSGSICMYSPKNLSVWMAQVNVYTLKNDCLRSGRRPSAWVKDAEKGQSLVEFIRQSGMAVGGSLILYAQWCWITKRNKTREIMFRGKENMSFFLCNNEYLHWRYFIKAKSDEKVLETNWLELRNETWEKVSGLCHGRKIWVSSNISWWDTELSGTNSGAQGQQTRNWKPQLSDFLWRPEVNPDPSILLNSP